MFHNKETSMVKVHQERQSGEEGTWELESEMYEKYPYLFLYITVLLFDV